MKVNAVCKRLLCLLLGHKPMYIGDTQGGKVFSVSGVPNNPPVSVHLCARCNALYWQEIKGVGIL